MSAISFDYDATYHPSAPIVTIAVDGYSETLGKRTLTAMLDTGADASMIPLDILAAVGAGYKETLWLRGAAGGRAQVDLYLVGIHIGAHIIRGIHVVGIAASEDAVVGRDVLNQLLVTLDGFAETTTIAE